MALTSEAMLAGYARGVFPMAQSRETDALHWFEPHARGIIPLSKFHISKSLGREIRRDNYTIRTNSAFSAVVALCAARPETWINAPLADLYADLHRKGFAHSIELWQDGALGGGLFGLTLGAAFFGESMFSVRPNASKIVMAHLVDRLRRGGFRLFDTQYLTPHLASLGGIEIPRAGYRARLAEALREQGDFLGPDPASGQEVVQRNAQRS